jgi:hypothetical protein
MKVVVGLSLALSSYKTLLRSARAPMSGVMVLDRSISHDHDMQMPGNLSSLLERLCIAFALELAAGRYQNLSAMLDQAASEQESAKKKYSSKQIQIIAEIGGVRWRAWADRAFQAFFSCHRPVSIALHICRFFPREPGNSQHSTSKRLDRAFV